MKKRLLKGLALAVVGSLMMVSGALAESLDYYTGNTSDSSYGDNGAEYFTLTDLTIPRSTPTIQLSSDIVSVYGHDYTVGMYSWDGASITSTLRILDSYMGYLASNVIFDLEAGTATSSVETAQMDTTFGFFIQFYTDDGSGILSSETYYTDDALGLGDAFSTFYDMNGIASVNFAEVALGIGGAGTQGHALVSVDDIAPVPEPATMLLFGAGLAGLAGLRRRAKQ